MDVVVKGRNVEVPEHFRQHVEEKLRRVERYDHKIIRVDVELFHEPNPRQAATCQRVEVTCKSRGPVVRAEACAETFYAALDTAAGRLQARLRKAADRRRVHHGSRTPTSLAVATMAGGQASDGSVERPRDGFGAHGALGALGALDGERPGTGELPVGGADAERAADRSVDHLPGRVVRVKEHAAAPMTLDQALFEMELVGHDFFLFADRDTGAPSVVYRRRGYDYGVIRLRS